MSDFFYKNQNLKLAWKPCQTETREKEVALVILSRDDPIQIFGRSMPCLPEKQFKKSGCMNTSCLGTFHLHLEGHDCVVLSIIWNSPQGLLPSTALSSISMVSFFIVTNRPQINTTPGQMKHLNGAPRDWPCSGRLAKREVGSFLLEGRQLGVEIMRGGEVHDVLFNHSGDQNRHAGLENLSGIPKIMACTLHCGML